MAVIPGAGIKVRQSPILEKRRIKSDTGTSLVCLYYKRALSLRRRQAGSSVPAEARGFDLLELEWQKVLGHPTWVLGTELRSSARVVCCRAISPAPKIFLNYTVRIICVCEHATAHRRRSSDSSRESAPSFHCLDPAILRSSD